MILADLHTHIDYMWSRCTYTDAQCVRHDSRRFTCIYRIGMCDTDPRLSPDLMQQAPTWLESLFVRLPALVDYLRRDSRRFTFIYRFYMVQYVRAWMINAAGTTLADLLAFIESASTI